MLDRQTKLRVLQPRPIYRQWLKHILLVSATLSIMVAGCSPRPSLRNNQEQMMSAIFYKDAQQCKADIQKQQQNYQTQLKAYQQGSITQAPLAPVLKVENCEPQMQAAIAEHNRHAPVYASLEDCQSEGLECEPTPLNSNPSGYRPVFGGAYIYPYGNTKEQRTSVIYGGTSYGIYRPYTVYRSLTPGNLVTPYGHTITQTTSGKVTVPSYTSLVAPERPKGTTAKGTIKGRSNSGFGSTYKSTGKGGK
jgi:hypothetical protein